MIDTITTTDQDTSDYIRAMAEARASFEWALYTAKDEVFIPALVWNEYSSQCRRMGYELKDPEVSKMDGTLGIRARVSLSNLWIEQQKTADKLPTGTVTCYSIQ